MPRAQTAGGRYGNACCLSPGGGSRARPASLPDEGGRVMQPTSLLQLRKPDPLAMARHLFKNPRRPAERLNAAAALLVVGLIVATGFGTGMSLAIGGLAWASGFSPVVGLYAISRQGPSGKSIMTRSIDSSTHHATVGAQPRFLGKGDYPQYKLRTGIMRNRVRGPATTGAFRIGP